MDIERYNMNLREVIKGLQHVTLISVTHNREMFTRHGLHLNSAGKELLSRVILRIQAVNSRDRIATIIHLPGKEEPTRKCDQNGVLIDLSCPQSDVSLCTTPSVNQATTSSNAEDHPGIPAALASNGTLPDLSKLNCGLSFGSTSSKYFL
jgi:hypothetical protein